MAEEKIEKKIKKKKEISREINIPEGIEVQVEPGEIALKKDNKELRRKYSGFRMKKENGKLVLYDKSENKRKKKMIMTTIAHIKNMIKGLEKGFEYKLEICSVHFPMNAEFKQDKKEFIIKNFLGEVKPRIARIPENIEIKINGNIITISSYDIEAAGLAAAIIERLSKVRNKDRRVFQDGIFIVSKPGRTI